MNFFVELMPANQAIFFKAEQNFFKFLPCDKFFLFDVIGILLNIFDAVDFIDALEEDDAGIRLFAFGSFFHGVDFAGEKVSEFIVMRATFQRSFSISFLGGVEKADGNSGNLSFSFGVLVENGRKAELPDIGKRTSKVTLPMTRKSRSLPV